LVSRQTITIATSDTRIAAFNPVTLNIGDSLELCVRGDLNGGDDDDEFVTLTVDGTDLTPPIGNLGLDSQCNTVPACETYSLAGIVVTNGQTVSVEITSSSEVGSFCEFNDATLRVVFPPLPGRTMCRQCCPPCAADDRRQRRAIGSARYWG
jgi:hypothetical protein